MRRMVRAAHSANVAFRAIICYRPMTACLVAALSRHGSPILTIPATVKQLGMPMDNIEPLSHNSSELCGLLDCALGV